MLTIDTSSIPSKPALRECARPRFDGSLERMDEWLAGLRSAGIRHSAPALMLALDNLRGANISSNRRLSILSTLKAPLLKTCVGLPKPDCAGHRPSSMPYGITLEQRLYRRMFASLNQALHQLDQQDGSRSSRQSRQREWTIRNLFRFANRQVRYAARWNIPLPGKTWLDLHELHVYLMTRRTLPVAMELSEMNANWTDPELEYKQLLLFGLAARLAAPTVCRDEFLAALPAWAAQTRLEDPHQMLGRIKLFLVAIGEDEPPRQQAAALAASFCGWVLQVPYSFVHQLRQDAFETVATAPNASI